MGAEGVPSKYMLLMGRRSGRDDGRGASRVLARH